jgi:hypothetical protein
MAGRPTARNERVAGIKARLTGNAMMLVPALALAGSLLLVAAGPRLGPEGSETEVDALLESLRQASALCSSTPGEPERQATVLNPAPTMK